MRTVAALCSLGVWALLLAGCTEEDSRPDSTGAAVAIYLTRDGVVAPVRRLVAAPAADSLDATMAALVEGPTGAEQRAGYATALPPGDPADVDVEVVDGVATVQPRPGAGALSDLGEAQIVHTLTQFPDVERVELANGKMLTRKAFEDEAPQILVESPLRDDEVSSPIRVSGTANVFEATVSLEVRDADDDVILEAFTTATSGSGTRGTFATELALPETDGPVTVVAFESSAKDGQPLHVVRVPVTLDG